MPTTLSASGAVSLSDWNDPAAQSYQWNQQHTSVLTMVRPFLDTPNPSGITNPVLLALRKSLTDFRDFNGRRRYKTFAEVPGYWQSAFTNYTDLVCPSDFASEVDAYVIFATQPVYRDDPGWGR
jgi:hypothetical protein